MNASKKVSWPIAAATAAAALLTAGSALADGRGHGHDRGRGIEGHHGGSHDNWSHHGSDYRSFRAPRHEYYRHYAWSPPRTYWRDDWRRDRWRHHYGYRTSYVYPSDYYASDYSPFIWANAAVGGRLLIELP